MSEEVFRPRLCHLRKWSDYEGYGFHLQAEKVKPGHFIGKVEEGSPADLGGLKTNDKVIEVNHKPVENITHHDVVAAIKEQDSEVKLLVVDSKTKEYFGSLGVEVTGTMAEIEHRETPYVQPSNFVVAATPIVSTGEAETKFQNVSNEGITQGASYGNETQPEVPTNFAASNNLQVPEASTQSAPIADYSQAGAAPAPVSGPEVVPAVSGNAIASNELSAAELRAQLKSKGKGKVAAKEDGQTFTDKQKAFQNL